MKSMTGFGSAKGVSGKLEITAEVKSVNNRHLDCNVKIPRIFNATEESLKAVVAQGISRGKVDVNIYVDSSGADDFEIKVNHTLAKAYVSALQEIARENKLPGDVYISDLTRFPDILQATKREIDAEVIAQDIGTILRDAMNEMNSMREREGEKLYTDITARLDQIEKLTSQVEEISPESVAQYRQKLETRMNEVLSSTTIDEARILTEAAIFADRVAINEEVVRLRSHISQFRELLTQDEPVGRKMDFLVQEMNREANTIGSKGNDARMSKIVVELKSEIEKVREQAMNVE